MASLGFETVIVNNHEYDFDSISLLFETFSKYGVTNFIFISNFDLTVNSFCFESQKIKNFKLKLSKLTPRGIHTKVFYNLIFDKGAIFNKDVKRLIAVKKHNSLLLTLPKLDSNNYDIFAQDMNHLLYKSGITALFTNFDRFIEGSENDIAMRLLRNPKVSAGFDLRYLFSNDKQFITDELISNNALFLPMVSHSVLDYVDIMNNSEEFRKRVSKDKFYKLSSNSRKCSTLFGL